MDEAVETISAEETAVSLENSDTSIADGMSVLEPSSNDAESLQIVVGHDIKGDSEAEKLSPNIVAEENGKIGAASGNDCDSEEDLPQVGVLHQEENTNNAQEIDLVKIEDPKEEEAEEEEEEESGVNPEAKIEPEQVNCEDEKGEPEIVEPEPSAIIDENDEPEAIHTPNKFSADVLEQESAFAKLASALDSSSSSSLLLLSNTNDSLAPDSVGAAAATTDLNYDSILSPHIYTYAEIMTRGKETLQLKQTLYREMEDLRNYIVQCDSMCSQGAEGPDTEAQMMEAERMLKEKRDKLEEMRLLGDAFGVVDVLDRHSRGSGQTPFNNNSNKRKIDSFSCLFDPRVVLLTINDGSEFTFFARDDDDPSPTAPLTVLKRILIMRVSQISMVRRASPRPSEPRILLYVDDGREIEIVIDSQSQYSTLNESDVQNLNFPDRAEECILTIGSHVLSYKKRRIAAVGVLQKSFDLMRIPIEGVMRSPSPSRSAAASSSSQSQSPNTSPSASPPPSPKPLPNLFENMWSEYCNSLPYLIGDYPGSSGNETGEHWKSLGFQGLSPATDIRGGGIWATSVLLAIPELIPSVLLEPMVKNRSYPFACVVISVAFGLLTDPLLLNLNETGVRSSPVARSWDSHFLEFLCVVHVGDPVRSETPTEWKISLSSQFEKISKSQLNSIPDSKDSKDSKNHGNSPPPQMRSLKNQRQSSSLSPLPSPVSTPPPPPTPTPAAPPMWITPASVSEPPKSPSLSPPPRKNSNTVRRGSRTAPSPTVASSSSFTKDIPKTATEALNRLPTMCRLAVICLLVFDRIWVGRNATYFDAPSVTKEMSESVSAMLASSPHDWVELREWALSGSHDARSN